LLNAQITIWDSPEEAPLSEHPYREKIKLESRKKDWDRIEQCLQPTYSHYNVIKNEFGQPFLSDGKFVSISHSDRFAATAISKIPVGIDIQVPHPSLFKVRHKYCHAEELTFLTEDPNDPRYLMLWSAKEAIFKIYGHQVDFAQDLVSTPFDKASAHILIHQQGDYHKKNEIIVRFIKNELYFVAVAQIQTP
jgi:phosphopantetheinyl transferase